MRKMRKGKIFTFMAANQIFFFFFFAFPHSSHFSSSRFSQSKEMPKKKKNKESMNGYVYILMNFFVKKLK